MHRIVSFFFVYASRGIIKEGHIDDEIYERREEKNELIILIRPMFSGRFLWIFVWNFHFEYRENNNTVETNSG